MEEQKAPTFALNVIADLRQKGLPIRYIWIGDGALRTEFERQAKDLGIADFVRLDGWRDDVSSCLQGLDVFVMPSKFEGMPLALLEAMAAGAVLLRKRCRWHGRGIDDGVAVIFARPEIWRVVRNARGTVRDPKLRAAIGSRAQDAAQRQFGVESMAGIGHHTIDVNDQRSTEVSEEGLQSKLKGAVRNAVNAYRKAVEQLQI